MIYILIPIALLLFIAFALFNASKLKDIHIQKEVTIKASKQEVFESVQYLKNFPKWSPFLEADPAQKYEVKGTDGAVGAQFHWEGNGGKDLGYQEIVSVKDGQSVGMKCDIQKPFVAQPSFNYQFTGSDGQVKVTQDFRLQSGLVDAFFMWLFGAKKDMAKMNQRGLDLLKISLEK